MVYTNLFMFNLRVEMWTLTIRVQNRNAHILQQQLFFLAFALSRMKMMMMIVMMNVPTKEDKKPFCIFIFLDKYGKSHFI